MTLESGLLMMAIIGLIGAVIRNMVKIAVLESQNADIFGDIKEIKVDVKTLLLNGDE